LAARSFPSRAVLFPDASRLADRLVLSLDASRRRVALRRVAPRDVADSTGGKTGSSNGFSRDRHMAQAFLGLTLSCRFCVPLAAWLSVL